MSTATAPSPQSPWPPALHTTSATTPIGLPQSTPPSVGQLGPPGSVFSTTFNASAASANQRGYFNLVVDHSNNRTPSAATPTNNNNRGVVPPFSLDEASSRGEPNRDRNQQDLASRRISTSSFEQRTQTERDQSRQADNIHGSDPKYVAAELPSSPSGFPKQSADLGHIELIHSNYRESVPNSTSSVRSSTFQLGELPSALPHKPTPPLSLGPPRVSRVVPSSGNPSNKPLQRVETMPAPASQDRISLISGRLCANYLKSSPENTLFIDIRPYPQFLKSRIRGSVNLCVPTTLLKRPTFSLRKLEETLTCDEDKASFARWQTSARIVAYDAASVHLKDSVSLLNVLKKFTNEGFLGEAFILHGGFNRFAGEFPECIESKLDEAVKPATPANRLSLSLPKPTVIGGCPMPTKLNCPVNPFFSNIRQNIELANGVGKIPVAVPSSMPGKVRASLPPWLRDVIEDGGSSASEKFFEIEKAEQNRMREAYTGKGPSSPVKPNSSIKGYRIAGIEKGTKNRYKDIYPFDHSRVRLQRASSDGCDYVNASHVQASRSNRKYIATQAPIPSTFDDFWRLVWEQDVRAIVMLTAELEGFQVKCHPYWKPDYYGPFKIDMLDQYSVSLEDGLDAHSKSPSPETQQTSDSKYNTGIPKVKEHPPAVIIRRLRLTHTSHSTEASKEVVQIHYSGWPDFGRPTKPVHLLRFIEKCHAIFNETNSDRRTAPASEPVPPGQRNIVVHCSAGCGRTGTFCTIDSVIDMLKRQKTTRRQGKHAETTAESRWIYRNDVDLVAETVEDFRHQRLSMVQTLQQFVLCYESVLEWMASNTPPG